MQTVRTVGDVRAVVGGWRRSGQTIGFVPTMGALHAGHLSLVSAARAASDRVAASIFVNPKQFGEGEDLDRYPRQEAADAAALQEAGCDLLYAPLTAEMYPSGFATTVSVSGLGEKLCGRDRPGHFDGVATVVAKLFNQVRPDRAFFGEKDWQQLTIIRRVVRDLDLPVEIVGVPTVREEDGLALSSRNSYLGEEDRRAAAALPAALRAAASEIAAGRETAATLSAAARQLASKGFQVHYLELRAADDLEPLGSPDRRARLFVAATLGGTRLIDNMPVFADELSAGR